MKSGNSYIHLQLTEMFRILEILSPGSDTN